MKGIEGDSATVFSEKARVDTSIANPEDRPSPPALSPQLTSHDMMCIVQSTEMPFLVMCLHKKRQELQMKQKNRQTKKGSDACGTNFFGR